MSTKAHYEVLETLGTGSFGTVCKLKRKADGKIVVWKDINFGKMSEKEKSQLVAEVNILRDLRNPFIVRYLDRIVDKPTTRLYIIMEHCAGGDLGKIISKCKKDKTTVDEAFIWKVFAQATLALKDCHRRVENGEAKPIIHRDLKPANILLDSTQNIKLGDFGLAKELSSKSKLCTTSVGTPYYMAPEILNEKDYDERSDIWSLGCLLYELAALRPPFDATNAVSLAMKINAGRFTRIPAKYSDALFDCIRSMLQTEPRRRPRVEDLESIPALQPALTQARLFVNEQTNVQVMQSKTTELSRREEVVKQREDAVKAREDAVAAAEAALAEKEKAFQKWMEQIQSAQQQPQQSSQPEQSSQRTAQAVPPPPPATRRLSVDRRMSIEPMACEDETDTDHPAMAQPIPLPPQPSFNFVSAVPNKAAFAAPPATGFTIFNDKANEMAAAVKHARDVFTANNAKPATGMRAAPGIPSFGRVHSAPSVPSNLLGNNNNGRGLGQRLVTGCEDAQENQDGGAFIRKGHGKCNWEGHEGDQNMNKHHNNNALIAEGAMSPWKKQRQFAAPVPGVNNNLINPSFGNHKAPTTHFVNLQSLLAGQSDDKRK